MKTSALRFALALLFVALGAIALKSYLDKPAIAAVRERNNRLAADSAQWVEQRDGLQLAYRKISFDLVTLDGENGRLRDRVTALIGDSVLAEGRVTALLVANSSLTDRLAGAVPVTRDAAAGFVTAEIELANVYPHGRTDVAGTVEIFAGEDSARAELDVSMESTFAVDWQRGEDLVSTCTLTPGHPKLVVTDLECAQLPDPIVAETRSGLLDGLWRSVKSPLRWLERGGFFLLGWAIP